MSAEVGVNEKSESGKKEKKGGIWTYDIGDEPAVHEKKYLDVNTHKFILKYNNLLRKNKKLERRASLEKKRAGYYKRKLIEIRELCNVGPSSSPETE